MTSFSSIKSGAVATVLALAMGFGGFAAPAQAAGISFNFGGGGGPNFGYGGPGVHLHFGDSNYYHYCLDDDGVVNRLERHGYDHVHIIRHDHGDDHDNKVWVVAQDYHGDWYEMRVDRCSHDVDHVRLVHSHHDHGDFDYNHFNFSFNF